MRRIAFACLCLTLSGCGFNTWWNPPFTSGTNPNMPAGDSENMRRVSGEDVALRPLTPEPGDVWPGPIAPLPTLQDLEQGGLQPMPEQPVPGSPLSKDQNPAPYTPPPPRGSSTPPPSTQPRYAPLPPMASPPTPTPVTPPARNPAGQIVQTPSGPSVTTGGTPGYQTTTRPGGGSAIIVPNGNGTSTIINSDGTIQTIPTPR